MVKTGNKLGFFNFDIVDVFFMLYLLTCGLEIVSFNALLQNVAFIFFIAISLYRIKGHVVFTKFSIIYGLFIVYSIISLVWSINISNSFKILRIFAKMYVIILFAISYYTTFRSIEYVFRFIYISLIISCVFVIITSSPIEWTNASVGKSVGMDTVRFSVKLAFCSFIAFYYWFKDKKSIVNSIIAVVMFVFSMLTGKRTGLMFVVIAVALFLMLRETNFVKKFEAFIRIVIIVGIIIILIFSIPALRNTIGERIISFVNSFFYGTDDDASVVQRTLLLNHTLDAIKNNPIFGSGMNATRSYLSEIGFGHVTYAHNNFLEILSTAGIIGVVIYYSNYAVALFKVKKIKLLENRDWFCFLIAFLVGVLVCDFVQVISESYYEMMLLGLICSGIHKCEFHKKGDIT